MSITSTAPGRASGNGHHTNTIGSGHHSQAHRAPAPAPASPASTQPGVIQLLRQADAAERQPAVPQQCPPGAGFSAEQIAALSAPLDRALVSSREQGRGRVNYLQSWVVISEANRIFGFDGWQRQTLLSRCIAQAERTIGRDQKPGWGVTYIARVRITVIAGERGLLIREGTGAGHGIDTDLGLAHESAIKEAETDAMKRALMTFGNPFGLALYDKSQRQVSGNAAPTQARASSHSHSHSHSHSQADAVVRQSRPTAPNPMATAIDGSPRPTTPALLSPATQRPATQWSATQWPPIQRPPAQPAAVKPAVAQPLVAPAADTPLDPPTIRSLQERIRGLLPPQLAAFSRAFRSAFQVPESTPSIAGLITQQRHRTWIQSYLAQGLDSQPQVRTA